MSDASQSIVAKNKPAILLPTNKPCISFTFAQMPCIPITQPKRPVFQSLSPNALYSNPSAQLRFARATADLFSLCPIAAFSDASFRF
ncbi:hypothetical protein AYI69_g9264 [Smittium culicis]|uniref:Uncharacterized protein n=1 Tax=Smittium culicis TaxID=133412 RepID=A0A1R1XDU7_9FUNG|nr:hypothetical protein AYI69_g9264 [Smittium culicis]